MKPPSCSYPVLLLARAGSQVRVQQQRGELVLSFPMSRLPSKSKHLVVVGVLLSAKGKMSIGYQYRHFWDLELPDAFGKGRKKAPKLDKSKMVALGKRGY